jgi:hypothetical protein
LGCVVTGQCSPVRGSRRRRRRRARMRGLESTPRLTTATWEGRMPCVSNKLTVERDTEKEVKEGYGRREMANNTQEKTETTGGLGHMGAPSRSPAQALSDRILLVFSARGRHGRGFPNAEQPATRTRRKNFPSVRDGQTVYDSPSISRSHLGPVRSLVTAAYVGVVGLSSSRD